MLSHTKVAKEFRRWVLDILDKEVSQNNQPNLPLVEPEPTYTAELTEYEIEQLAWLCFSHRQMNDLIGLLIDPLEALGSRYGGIAYSHHHEYKRHYTESLATIKRLIEPFGNSKQLGWTRVIPRLTKN